MQLLLDAETDARLGHERNEQKEVAAVAMATHPSEMSYPTQPRSVPMPISTLTSIDSVGRSRTKSGHVRVRVPRDRKGTFEVRLRAAEIGEPSW